MSPEANRPNFDINKAIEYSTEFGGAVNIPEELLTGIGYCRPNPDDPGYITPIEVWNKKLASLSAEKKWGEKIPPFGRIEIDLTRSGGYRRIGERDFFRFSEMLENFLSIENIGVPDESLSPEVKRLRRVFERFSSTQQKDSVYQIESFDWITSSFVMGNWFNTERAPLPSFLLDENLSEYYTEEGVPAIGSLEARKLSLDLERAMSIVSDQDIIKEFSRHMAEGEINNFIDIFYQRQYADGGPYAQALRSYAQTRDIRTDFDMFKNIYADFLSWYGMTDVAKKVTALSDPSAISERLTKEAQSINDSLLLQEKELRRQIASTDRADTARLRALNSDLKQIDDTKYERKAILVGLSECFSPQKQTSEYVKRQLKKLQDFLKTGSATETKDVIIIDATPDAKLDKDPGIVSGDCTAGNPLPFDRPEIPIFNVKVFQKEGAHLGNIYLVITEVQLNTGKTVTTYHLDAIQIPDSNIIWTEFIPKLFDVLGKEAARNGVEAVTVNAQPQHISNYDYISDAVLNYARTRSDQSSKDSVEYGKIDVDSINSKIPDGYSYIQATETALVVWRNQTAD